MKQPDFLPIHDLHCDCVRCTALSRAQPRQMEEHAPRGTGFAIAALFGCIGILVAVAFLR